ncbi:TIP-1 family-domain-containing protein [Lipomyces oligophaga]|uniref:TIP-1 family-domain-containing protein n=1 Tax=Lipomyces oligophaga TaxID=45792 RepID=UPI0034CFD403
MATINEYITVNLPDIQALARLDGLVSGLEEEQAILNTKIQDTQERIQKELDELIENSNEIYKKADIFQETHGQLKTEVVDSAVQERPEFLTDLQILLRKLDKFAAARAYFDVLNEAFELSTEAKSSLKRKDGSSGDVSKALQFYSHLEELETSIIKRSQISEDSAGYLVQFIKQFRLGLWKDLQNILVMEFREALSLIGWPKSTDLNSDFTEFIKQFNRLLEFQYSLQKVIKNRAYEQVIAFSVLIEPLVLRFRYHFEGPRETNNITKPEWFFQHFLSSVEEHVQLMQTIVQAILEQSDFTKDRIALHEFIYAYLPCIEDKLQLLFPALVREPQVLSHLMLESMKFDDVLRTMYLFEPFSGKPFSKITGSEWPGVTGTLLKREEWFTTWLSIEKEFALARYKEIIEAQDAWIVDFDASGLGEAKPTKSALRLKDLLEAVSERYRPLNSFVHKVRFLVDIQISILDSFHSRISASLDAFESLSSSLVRAVSGMQNEEQLKLIDGIAGIERLCRAYGSSFAIKDALYDWGEDIFFLELYNDISRRTENLHTLKQSTKLPTNSTEEGTIFDEVIKDYNSLANRAEALLIKHLNKEIQKVYKTDISFRQKIKSKEGTPEQVINSSATIAAMLEYLSRALARASYTRVSIAVYSSLNW